MAGPNGSGKSTVLREVRKNFYSGPFVNADEIELLLKTVKLINLFADYDLEATAEDFTNFLLNVGKSWVDKAHASGSSINIECNDSVLKVTADPSAYDAAAAADFIRQQLLTKGSTFTFETVLSHSSKIALLEQSKAAGYKNYLYFICTIDPAINKDRVLQRVRLQGHNVPADKIEKRYYESLSILPRIIPLCHRVYLFDNSTTETNPDIQPVAEINQAGELKIHYSEVPWWVNDYVIRALYL